MAKDNKKAPVTDPLEAAKKAAPEDTAAPAEVPVAMVPAAPAGEPVTKAMVEMPKPAPDVKAVSNGKFRVVETTTISLGGSFVKLNRDDIVSAALYGPLGLKQIMDANVPLQEVTESK